MSIAPQNLIKIRINVINKSRIRNWKSIVKKYQDFNPRRLIFA